MIANGSSFTVSVIDYGTSTNTKPIEFHDALAPIGEGRWRGAIQKIRAGYKAAGGGQPGKDAVARQKLQLAGILFSGTFITRKKENLIQHSGLICCDLDKLGDQTAAIKESVTHDPCVLAAFLSPTGEGLKVVLRCDPTRHHENETYPAAHLYMLERFGVDIDDACSDVSRICYVSDDPDIYIADHADCIPYPITIKPVPYEQPAVALGPRQSTRPGDDYSARGDIPSLLKSHGWTPIGKTGWRRPGKDWGLSATYGYYPGMFHVFSSSTQFTPNHAYSGFQVFTFLECSGDFSEAAKRLAKLQYGENREKPMLPPIKNDMPGQVVEVEDESWEEAAVIAVPVDRLTAKRVRLSTKPPEPVTRLFLAGKPIATPGNLVTLISRAKTGKTAAIGAAIAAIIGAHHERGDLDTFGFTAPHNREAVVLIDTEQSPYDAFICHERALKRAGDPQDPDWLCHYALVGESAEQLCKDLILIITKAKAAHGGIFTIIIDGIADFVESVNDEAECNNFISWLRSIAVEYNCPIICVIHSNEAVKSGDDGRGHLGKQLTRKAESNLLLKKVGEITTITSEKQRKAPITETDGIAFRWSDQLARHISCAVVHEDKIKGGRPKKYTFSQIRDIFLREPNKGLTRQIILRFADDKIGIGGTALRAVLDDAVRNGELIQSFTPNAGYVYKIVLP